ncbi:MAG: YihA family ribosome biogenesis GTP-binding protein [Alphaproteobacteria bacterium]|nr:YihA family ribosome biogenesis GTP-binding protein [Alphaproteobacteria bacterium]
MATITTPKKAESFFTGNCVFAAGAPTPESLPRENFPEIAFIGRSNVGKSSLVNALTGKNMLARVSNTPGRTQQLNFFRLGDRMMLVDMPGYGYAKASKTAIYDWNCLIDAYLKDRGNLKRLCLLIDARHGVKENDREFMHRLHVYAVPFVVIITKTDKIKKSEIEAVKESVEAEIKKIATAWPKAFLTSAEKGLGIEEVRLFLAQYVL